jgi:predicted RNA binding protein YcfA (HicA-like mRNA interferase family)
MAYYVQLNLVAHCKRKVETALCGTNIDRMGFGYVEYSGSGSRRKFIKKGDGGDVVISLHEPHPGNILKSYLIRQVIEHLRQEKHL